MRHLVRPTAEKRTVRGPNRLYKKESLRVRRRRVSPSKTHITMPNITDAKCVLVIGATAGIGRALALAIHGLPSKPTVIVGGRRQERIDELCKEGERIQGVQVDVSGSRDTIEAFVADIVAQYPEVGVISLFPHFTFEA